MHGWIFQRRRDGALFRVVRVNRNAPYLRVQEIETAELLTVTVASLRRPQHWQPVGAARSLVGPA